MSTRRTLPLDQVAPSALKKVTEHHRDIVDEVIEAVAKHDLVIVGMSQNPNCKRARLAADKAGQRFKYLEYGSYLKNWQPRLAIKMWSGWPTYPQVFCCGKLVGGADQLEEAIRNGDLAKMMLEGREAPQD